MKFFPRNRFRTVGVHFGAADVSLAVRHNRRVGPLVYRKPVDPGAPPEARFGTRVDGCRAALSELVTEKQLAGARCTAAIPLAYCRVEWVWLAGARLRDLRTAVGHSAFWQSHLGVTTESCRVWWRLTRGNGRVGALLAAVPRQEIDPLIDAISAVGLGVGPIGISCFDFLDGGLAAGACKVVLVLDAEDSCVVSFGSSGIRAHSVKFDAHGFAGLSSSDPGECGRTVDGLATCVRRCIGDEQASARVGVKVVVTRGVHGSWVELLKARLPGFTIELVDGWAAAGLSTPGSESGSGAHSGPECLPRAAARLARYRSAPAVNFAARRVDNARRRRYLLTASAAASCLLGGALAYSHWAMLAEHRRLQPEAGQYALLLEARDRIRTEIEALRSSLSHRVSFYSGIQRVSFERKLLPRLLASVEHAVSEGMWLNTVVLRQPGLVRVTGRALDDERIARFIERLRAVDEITDVFLESSVRVAGRRVKDFVVSCHLRVPGENPEEES